MPVDEGDPRGGKRKAFFRVSGGLLRRKQELDEYKIKNRRENKDGATG
jgi:hypothetical protein